MLEHILKEMYRLQGHRDSRGPVAQFSRGNNIYNSASFAAHRGGGTQFGRPKGAKTDKSKEAIARRLANRGR